MYKGFCSTSIEFMDKESLVSAMTSAQKRMVLILSESAARRYNMENVASMIGERKDSVWIRESVSYPNQDTIINTLAQIDKLNPEIIFAIGGGSSIDLAKVVKAFYMYDRIMLETELSERLQQKCYLDNDIQIVAVPTTAGTGAEVTKWATVWDRENKCKYSVDADNLKPDNAYIIPEFMAGAGIELTISTGLDSVAHAMEAYWSKKSNPLVRELAKQSLYISTEVLGKIVDNPDDIMLREKQSVASLISGLAFSMTRTTACHSISYPLTMDYGIQHGIAVAMTLPSVLEMNEGYYVEAEELKGVFAKQGGFTQFLDELCKKGNISLKLVDYGVKKEEIMNIVNKTFTLGRMDNNPVLIDKAMVEEILMSIYH